MTAKKKPAKKREPRKPIDDQELELVLSEIIRSSDSAVARMQAVRELRALRDRRERGDQEEAAAQDEFGDLDDLAPRRAARRSR